MAGDRLSSIYPGINSILASCPFAMTFEAIYLMPVRYEFVCKEISSTLMIYTFYCPVSEFMNFRINAENVTGEVTEIYSKE